MADRNEGSGNPIHQAHGIDTYGGDPPPPYQITTRNFLFLRAEFDRSALRESVPEELDISDDNTGFIGMVTSDGGWGLEPYSLFYIALDIKGAPSADGTPGLFRAVNYYEGQPFQVFNRHYNARMEEGYSKQWREGRGWQGEAGRTTPELRVTLERLHDEQPPPASGIHHYQAEAPGGGINSFFITYTGQFCDAKCVSYDVLDTASERLGRLTPTNIQFAYYIPSAPLAISEPYPFDPDLGLGTKPAAIRLGLMDIISRIGHAAALVNRDGRLLFANDRAKEMLSTVQVGGRLMAWRRRDQTLLDGELRRIGATGALVSDRIALERPDASLPLIARALPVAPALAGKPAFLVLFTEPEGRISQESECVLQILGLTPAEARLAALVGAGLSAKDGAEMLNVTVNTARSTLKVVYDKLGIGKQSELAGIIARLE